MRDRLFMLLGGLLAIAGVIVITQLSRFDSPLYCLGGGGLLIISGVAFAWETYYRFTRPGFNKKK